MIAQTLKSITPYDVAASFIGRRELPGDKDDPLIMEFLRSVVPWAQHDEVPWCAAFVNWICERCGLPRSKSAAARSWLAVGTAVALVDAARGWDVVILSRGAGPQPGPEVLQAQGHVGFFCMAQYDTVQVLGGNQGNQVSVAQYPVSRVLGVRRLTA